MKMTVFYYTVKDNRKKKKQPVQKEWKIYKD